MNKVALGVVISLLAGFAVGAWFGGEQPAADRPVASRAGALPAEASSFFLYAVFRWPAFESTLRDNCAARACTDVTTWP